jgi:hypothetical protein
VPAKQIYLLCGTTILNWDMLVSFTSTILAVQLHHFIRGEVPRPNDAADGFSAISQVQGLRNVRSQGHTIFFPLLLEVGRTRMCYLDVDRIYALLVLMPGAFQRHFAVDYSLSVRDVYLKCCKLIIRTDPILYLLHSACKRSILPGLPSWCPTFNHPSSANNLGTLAAKAGYWAGYRSLKDLRKGLALFEDSDSIVAPGFKMDTVSSVIPGGWLWPKERDQALAGQTLSWEASCLSLAQQLFNSPDGVPEAYWRTLIANKESSHDPCTSDLSSEYLAMIKHIRETSEKEIVYVTNGDAHVKLLNHSSAVDMVCKGRKFFSTEKGRIWNWTY